MNLSGFSVRIGPFRFYIRLKPRQRGRRRAPRRDTGLKW